MKNNNIKAGFIKFSTLSIFYEKLLSDFINKIILDLNYKENEMKYYEEIKESYSKVQNIFESYNKIILEFKKIVEKIRLFLSIIISMIYPSKATSPKTHTQFSKRFSQHDDN